MKKATVYIVLFSLVFSSCKKENESTIINNDNIIYTKLLPNIEVTSVDSLIPHGSGCGDIPSPSDSTASVSIDINNDGAIDYILTCSSWYNFVSASGPCVNYNTNILISGTSNENQIAVTGNYNVVNLLGLDNTVDSNRTWTQGGTLMSSSVVAPFSYNFSGNKYIGVRIKNGQLDNFGWIYLNKTGYKITIISYAINLSGNNAISTGQIE